MTKFFFTFFILLTVSCVSSFAQAPDSLRVVTDSLQLANKEDVDTLINYSADKIDFDVANRTSVLSGNAVISYKSMTLEAGQVEVNWDEQTLIANSLADTVFKDSAQTEIDTVILRGKPHFIQATDDFYGDEIAYNMKTKVGRVTGGTTQYEDGKYRGELFKRVSSDVINVKNGEFTSCNADTPHYHFGAHRLKIMVGKRLVAQPVTLYFDDVPVLIAPYGIFPQQHGRSSGIIIPTFGESGSQGRFLKNIGYYWAPSQYMDLLGTIDYYERFGILGGAEYRYAKRYMLDGGTKFNFNTQKNGTEKRRDYQIVSTHNQILARNSRLVVSGAYTSSENYSNNVGTVQDILNQSVRSSANFSKSWLDSPWSLGIGLSYTQNIRQKTWNSALPSIRLTHSTGKLFPPPKAPLGIRKAFAPKELEPPWYRTFTWSYSADYQNELSLPRQVKPEGLIASLPDSLGRFSTKTFYGNDTLSIFQKDGLRHSGSISATATLLKFFNLNPSLNVTTVMTRQLLNYEAVNDTLLDRADEHGFYQRTSFNLGTSLATTLYGLAEHPFGFKASFRHVMKPNIGFRFTPDFSDKQWGYFKTIELSQHRSLTYDRFDGTFQSSNVGGTQRGLSEKFSFGLDHLFQLKTGNADDNNEKRFDLLSAGNGTGYDVARDSLRWDNLGSSFRTSIPGKIGPIEGLALDVSLTHSFYQEKPGNRGQRINKFYWDRKNANWYEPIDLLNSSFDVSLGIRTDKIGSFFGLYKAVKIEESDSAKIISDSLTAAAPPPNFTAEAFGKTKNSPPTPAEVQGGGALSSSQTPAQQTSSEVQSTAQELFQMPFDLRLAFRKSNDYVSGTSTASFGASAGFNLTPRYDINMTYAFDLDRNEVRDVHVTATRELSDCWEASFNWSPLGYRPGYFLRIGLKSPQLHDVKIERQRGAGVRGYY